MWQKLVWKLFIRALVAINVKKLLLKLLLRLAVEIKEQTGLIVYVEKLDLDRVINGFEEVLSDYFGVNVDINGDGQTGDGKEG